MPTGSSCGPNKYCKGIECVDGVCGDAVVTSPEDCDNGNANGAGTGCESSCKFLVQGSTSRLRWRQHPAVQHRELRIRSSLRRDARCFEERAGMRDESRLQQRRVHRARRRLRKWDPRRWRGL
jgi:hypothetical protein